VEWPGASAGAVSRVLSLIMAEAKNGQIGKGFIVPASPRPQQLTLAPFGVASAGTGGEIARIASFDSGPIAHQLTRFSPVGDFPLPLPVKD
jgi:hypothetical protein